MMAITVTTLASPPTSSVLASFILSFINILDDYGAKTWNLRAVALVTALILGTIRLCFGKKHGVDWYNLLHAIISGVAASMCVYLDLFWAEEMTGVPEPLRSVQCGGPLTSLHRVVPAITMGFSMFDMLDGMMIGPDFLAHGAGTMFVMAFFCENNLSHLVAPMLLMEVSTIPLNLVRAEFFNPATMFAAQISFAISFTLCRVVIVPYIWLLLILTIRAEMDSPEYKECFPSYFHFVVLGFGLFFHFLNFYWFIKIVKKVKRKLTGVEKITENNDVADPDGKKGL